MRLGAPGRAISELWRLLLPPPLRAIPKAILEANIGAGYRRLPLVGADSASGHEQRFRREHTGSSARRTSHLRATERTNKRSPLASAARGCR